MSEIRQVWTYQDFVEGRCESTLVGTEKPPAPPEPAPTVELPPPDPTKTMREILKADLPEVYHALGGKEFLKQNPDLVSKLMLRIVAPDPAPPVQNNLNIGWPAWLTARRLAYQESSEVAPDIALEDHGAPQRLAGPTAVETLAPVPEVAPTPPTPLKPSAAIADSYPEDLTKIVKISDIKPDR